MVASHAGVRRLIELAVQKDLAWLEKDLRALSRLEAGCTCPWPLRRIARNVLRASEALHPLARTFHRRANFDAAVAEAKQRFPGLATAFMDRLQLILQLRQQVRQRLEGASSAAPKSRTLSSLGQPPHLLPRRLFIR